MAPEKLHQRCNNDALAFQAPQVWCTAGAMGNKILRIIWAFYGIKNKYLKKHFNFKMKKKTVFSQGDLGMWDNCTHLLHDLLWTFEIVSRESYNNKL